MNNELEYLLDATLYFVNTILSDKISINYVDMIYECLADFYSS